MAASLSTIIGNGLRNICGILSVTTLKNLECMVCFRSCIMNATGIIGTVFEDQFETCNALMKELKHKNHPN